jgi:hypothetical protein
MCHTWWQCVTLLMSCPKMKVNLKLSELFCVEVQSSRGKYEKSDRPCFARDTNCIIAYAGAIVCSLFLACALFFNPKISV